MSQIDTVITTVDTLTRIDMQPTGELVNYVHPISYQVQNTVRNFYLPDRGGAKTNVHPYDRIIYPNIYPYVDEHFYNTRSGQKLAFVVRPGGSPSAIRLHFTGQDSLHVDLWGMLRVYFRGRYFVLPQAIAYQVSSGGTIVPISWAPQYNASSGNVTFTVGSYLTGLPLIFQIGPAPIGGSPVTPGVCWSTYFAAEGEDQIKASTTDAAGNYYPTGFTYATEVLFPMGVGQSYVLASPTAFVSKFSAINDGLIWSDLIGGSFGDQYATGIAVKPGVTPSIYIGGRTDASDFFTQDPGTGAYMDLTGGGPSGFLCKFASTTGALQWSTYFGNGGSFVQNICAMDNGRIAVVGETDGDLPVHQVPLPPMAEQWTYQGGIHDAYVATLTPLDQVLWSTFIGGSGTDNVWGVKATSTKLVVAGHTNSPTIQTLDGGPNAEDHATNAGGATDLLLMEFTVDGDQTWGTFLGGSGQDLSGRQGLAISPVNGDMVLVGSTTSNDLPYTFATGEWHDDTPYSGFNGCIVQINGSDRSLKWLTLVSGTGGATFLETTVIQNDGRIFVGGYTVDELFPHTQALAGLYNSNTLMGPGDGLLMCFSGSHALEWSTLFGGSETAIGDKIWSLALRDQSRLLAAGTTAAAYDLGQFFPLTDPGTGAWFDQELGQPIDPFISSFCIAGLLTQIPTHPSTVGFELLPLGGNSFVLVGLNAGSYDAEVLDDSGRSVAQPHLRSDGLRSTVIDLNGLARGMYALMIPGSQAVKIIITR